MFGMKTAKISLADAKEAADNHRKSTLDIERIQAEIQNEQAEIASKREEELASLAAIQSTSKATLEKYLKENQDELLDSKKSTKFAGIVIGFRKATTKLTLVGKKNTWKAVLAKITADENLDANFTLLKKEVDKIALKKADEKTLKNLGLTIEQPDNFFVRV